jgi:hypothetical protein
MGVDRRQKRMRVYVMQFESVGALRRAFDRLSESVHVGSCMIEPGLRRIRFLAPLPAAEALVHQVYLDRGMTWCSRHDFTSHEERSCLPPVDSVPRSPARRPADTPARGGVYSASRRGSNGSRLDTLQDASRPSLSILE